MEITREEHGSVLHLHVAGRLDAYWADHLSEEISAAVREGRRFVSLNFSRLTYISSAGIRVLMSFYKQLRALEGSLTVVEPTGRAGQRPDSTRAALFTRVVGAARRYRGSRGCGQPRRVLPVFYGCFARSAVGGRAIFGR